MPASCLICGATKKFKVKLFHFAVITQKLSHLQEISKRRRHEWLRVLRKTEDDLKTRSGNYICSKHFVSGEPSKVQDVTDPDWIPSLNLTPITDLDTQKRKSKKTRKPTEKCGAPAAKYMKTAANTSVGMDGEQDDKKSHAQADESAAQDSSDESGAQAPADESGAQAPANESAIMLPDSLNNFKWMLDQKDLVIHCLRAKLRHHVMDESSFVDDDLKTQFYTGFATYKCFAAFVGVVGNYLPECDYPGVSKIRTMIVVMAKLRLNLPLAYMSLKFEIPFVSLCEIFTASVNRLADNLQVSWPAERKVPKFLKGIFGNQLAAIVDIIELQLDYGSGTCQSIKFLVAYSPCGRTAFVSKPFPGISTDRCIVSGSGLLAVLKPSDLILALRGTLSEDLVAAGGVRHKVFMYGVVKRGLIRMQWNEMLCIDMKNNLRALMDQLATIFGFLGHKQPEIWMASPTEFLTKVVKLSAALRNIILGV